MYLSTNFDNIFVLYLYEICISVCQTLVLCRNFVYIIQLFIPPDRDQVV